MDVGSQDEFGFGRHYDNFVALLRSKGLTVTALNDFPGNCTELPNLSQPFLMVRYTGGHVGVPEADDTTDELLHGNVCGQLVVWQRLLTLFVYIDASFPDGFHGPGDITISDIDPRGDIMTSNIAAPSLRLGSGATPNQSVLIYRPPAYFHTTKSFPILYILPGYGQSPDDYERLGDLLDPLIVSKQLQNMFVAVLPVAGGRKGSFFVNHHVPETQVPDLTNPTSGRYEDSIVNDLIPTIENNILRGRVRQ
jgi:hypothetical protein